VTLKFLVVSDFHGNAEAFREAAFKAKQTSVDAIIISGDITDFGSVQNAKELLSPLVRLRFPVFFVPGNCDPPSLARFNWENVRCLHGSCVSFGDVILAGVGGGPLSPFDTPFEMTEAEITQVLTQSSQECQPKPWRILVSHTPPKDTKLDATFSGEHVGSSSLRRYIEDRQPSIAFCGHIHEAKGIDKIGNTLIVNPGPAKHNQCAIAKLDEKIEVKLDRL
jgi:hypothetical protein